MARCDAMAWASSRGGCDGCGRPLTGRQTRWCSDDCADLYWTNHRWPRARAVAVTRSRVFMWRWRTRSDGVRVAYWALVGYQCERCRATTLAPEVNHREPAMGAHGLESCIHHQENLEVLCRSCHLAETNRQRLARAGRVPSSAEQLALV